MNDQINSFGHHVPRFVLRYFLDGEKVHIYDRKNNSYGEKSPKSIAGEKAYYVFTDKQGNKNDALEKMFTQIETHAAEIVRDLHQGKKSITEQEKADLGMFLAAQYARVPEALKKSEKMSVEGAKEIMKRAILIDPHLDESFQAFEKKMGIKLSDKEKEEYKKTLVDKKYDVKFPKEHMLKTMIELMREFYLIMAQMEWIVFFAPEQKAFISSDNPVYTFNSRPEGFWGSGLGLLAPNCETTAVLTPKVTIYLSQKHNPSVVKFYKAPRELVDTLNGRTAICSSRFLFSHSLPLVRRMVERTKLWKRLAYSQIKVC